MTRNHYQNAHAVLIVYGLDSIESYKSVENHVHDVGHYCNNPDIKIFAVEPFASPILNGGEPGGHPIQGIGPNFIPKVLDTKIYNEVLDVTADDAVNYARRAASEEGILAGISSGAALWATSEIAKRPEFAGKTIVVIIPSFGERYLSTILYQDLMDA